MCHHWYTDFKKRHPEIRGRKSKKLDVHRALAADPWNFEQWFDELEKFYDDLYQDEVLKTPRPLPSQLANMDEKHFDPRGKDPEKIAEAGKPNCYTITQGEKSSLHVTDNGSMEKGEVFKY